LRARPGWMRQELAEAVKEIRKFGKALCNCPVFRREFARSIGFYEMIIESGRSHAFVYKGTRQGRRQPVPAKPRRLSLTPAVDRKDSPHIQAAEITTATLSSQASIRTTITCEVIYRVHQGDACPERAQPSPAQPTFMSSIICDTQLATTLPSYPFLLPAQEYAPVSNLPHP
jgi:hypothetical protein